MRRSFHARRGDGTPGLAARAGMTHTRRMTDLALIPWAETAPPVEATLRARLEREGFSVFAWTDAPGARYAPHAHDRDESIWVVAGEIAFTAAGRTVRLGPGDRLLLPAGTVHAAEGRRARPTSSERRGEGRAAAPARRAPRPLRHGGLWLAAGSPRTRRGGLRRAA